MLVRIQKSVLSFSLASFAVGALILFAPQASHAVTSTLVQKAAPAITPRVASPGSQSVELRCDAAMGNYGCYQFNGDGSIDFGNLYTVPAAQKLVVLTISLMVTHPQRVGLFVGSDGRFSGHEFWMLDKAGSYQYQYPSGIIVAAGKNLEVSLSDLPDFVYVYGYLAPQ